MSRNKGDLDFSANIEVLKVVPLDARQLVGTKADLTGATTWNQSGDIWLFDGAIVSVGSDPTTDNNGIYFLSDAVNYDNINSWKKADSGTGSGTVTSATNGLNIDVGGTTVALGGILTTETIISGGTQTLRLGHTSSLLDNLYADVNGVAQIQAHTIYTNASTSGTYKGGGFCITLNATDATFCDNSVGNDGLKYASCISTGFTNSCSIIDKGYVDDKANTVEVNNVSVNFTASTSNDFIGVSGATEIWLPTTPKPCQRIIVADICGNALIANICIIGNGLCINGNDSATINTEYGAMTFINNGYSWSAVAFIN